MQKESLLEVTSDTFPGAGLKRHVCDNEACRKPIVIAWQGRDGEYCSNKCLKLKEEGGNTMVTATDDNTEGAATQTAPETKKKAVKGKAKVKAAKKGKAKAAAKKSKAAAGDRLSGDSTITVLKKASEFRGKRETMFNKLKTGMTVKEVGDLTEKVWNGSRYSGFIHVCVEAGLIKVNAPKG